VCKKYLEETPQGKPIGTGAYKLDDFVYDDYVKLERFDDYWGDKPEVKNVTFKIIRNHEEMKNALINGEIDIASHIETKYYDEVTNSPGVTIECCSQPTVSYISFDFRENDSIGFPGEKNPLCDIRVRKAIYESINVSYIIDKIYNGSEFAEPATQLISPMIFGYNPDIKRLDYDPEGAKELMREAGYGDKFNLTMDCVEDLPIQQEFSEIIQSQLSGIINLEINYLPVEEYYSNLFMKNTSFYHMTWLTSSGDGGEIFDYLLRTVDQKKGIGTYNLGFYSNPLIDSIGENISYILEPEERLALMQQGFKIAMDDVCVVPLYIAKYICGIADDIAWAPKANLMIKAEEISFKG